MKLTIVRINFVCCFTEFWLMWRFGNYVLKYLIETGLISYISSY